MSGIPVYTSSPIRGPQTAPPEGQIPDIRSNIDAGRTTTSASSTTPYPPARPGASVPAPTAAAGLMHRNEPLHPTPTTKIDEPAHPQPGAVPVPPNTHASNIPPPPKTGETYHQPYPPQMAISPPKQSFRTQSTTSSAPPKQPSNPYPVSLPVTGSGAEETRRSLEHPPGYHQNIYASELTNSQRLAMESVNASDSTSGGGYEDDEGVWSAAKKWAQTAGSKLSEAEQEVWKRINKE